MIRRLLLACAVVLGVLVLPAGALGHAVLQQTDPINDAVLPVAPSEITMTFSEPVDSVGSIQVFDGDAREVDTDPPQTPRPETVRVGVPGPLANGTYTVAWRILSEDGHAVTGAFVFHVGERGANPEGVVGRIASGEPGTVLQAAESVARYLDLALLVLLVGGAILLTTALSGVAPPVEARLWYTVSGFGFGLSVAAAATIVIQGAIVRGLTVGGDTKPGLLGAVLTTQFGQVRLAQLLIAEVVAICAVWAASVHRGRGIVWSVRIGVLLLAATPALSGHASVRGPAAVLLDTVHTLAASVWVGGLAVLLLGLAIAGGARRAVARHAIPRFSSLAVVAVGALVLTGAVNGLIELGGIDRLWSTRYGLLLLAKIVLAAVLIGLGARNRRDARGLADGVSDGGVARLRRTMGVELAVMAVVLGVTTALVATPPARSTAAGGGPVEARTSVGDLDIRLVVDPARSGPNLVHVYLSRGDRSADADEVRVAATQTSAGIGPITAPAARDAPGHYVAQSMPLGAPGRWTFVVSVRQGEFDQVDATLQVQLRGPAGGQ